MDPPDAIPEELPLPDPFPDYLSCPHCGEAEVEVWCYETQVQCHQCGEWFDHQPHAGCRIGPTCQAGAQWKRLRFSLLMDDGPADSEEA